MKIFLSLILFCGLFVACSHDEESDVITKPFYENKVELEQHLFRSSTFEYLKYDVTTGIWKIKSLRLDGMDIDQYGSRVKFRLDDLNNDWKLVYPNNLSYFSKFNGEKPFYHVNVEARKLPHEGSYQLKYIRNFLDRATKKETKVEYSLVALSWIVKRAKEFYHLQLMLPISAQDDKDIQYSITRIRDSHKIIYNKVKDKKLVVSYKKNSEQDVDNICKGDLGGILDNVWGLGKITRPDYMLHDFKECHTMLDELSLISNKIAKDEDISNLKPNFTSNIAGLNQILQSGMISFKAVIAGQEENLEFYHHRSDKKLPFDMEYLDFR